MRVVLAAALLTTAHAGCYSPEVQYGIPCAEVTHACPTGQECDLITNTCQPPLVMQTWRDDSAADFSADGPVLVDATIEPNGAVGPMPYLTGRVRFTGVQGARVPADPTTAVWTEVASGPVTGRGFSDLHVDYGTAIPDGLGLVAGDDVTILVEGELALDATGMWRFELTANDAGFLEIAAPGTDTFTPVVADADATTLGSYAVTTAGWHRFRAAFSDASTAMDFRVRYDAPGGSMAMRDVTSDMMRTRVDDLAGYIADGFEEVWLIRHRASTLVDGGLDHVIPDNAYGIRIGATWSMRWSGQMLIETAGDYAFHLTAHHGARLWIDGASLADNMGSTDTDATTSPVTLEPGWHDVVVDVMRFSDATEGAIALTVASGPALAGQTVPVIRPVLGRGVRFAATSSSAITAIPDGATVSRSLTLDLPANMTPISIDTLFEIDHPVIGQVSIVLDPPVGANITQLAAGDITGAGEFQRFRSVPAADAGATWTWTAGDSDADTAVGDLTGTGVTLVCSGGIAPFPTSYHYESSVRTVGFGGDVVSLGAVRWQLRQGTTANVYFRTCELKDACSAEPWTEVANGAVPMVPARTFVQYAVDFTSDGDTPTALDWIEQDYSIRPLPL